MRRIIIIGIAIAVLGSGAAAWASSTDPNNYSGSSVSVSPAKAGKAKRPVIDAWTQTIKVSSNQAGLDSAPLKDIKTWIYGLKVNSKVAKTCSSSKIETNYLSCPGKSLVASGSVTSRLGTPDRNPSTSTNCGPLTLNVYNGGKNFVWFFFIVSGGPASCPGAHTGSAAPYKGTFSRSNGNLVLNVPLPPDVSTDAANIGAYASLTNEHLVWKKLTKRINGKRVGYFSSVGCKAGKRPIKVTFTDTTNGSNRFSTTKTGKLTC
ncbi:MAG TPA: hypothetical protein VG321_01580 [Solirubrobacteraceae bacterium]|nr:hypothetical protein [Solirubrobacteraceae bacterium]